MSEYITDPELLKKLNSSSGTSSDGYVTDPELLKKLNSETKPESKMPKPVEGEGGAAFGVYRPAGRRPESQQNREAAKEMPVQTARGVVTGALGGIPDILNIPGQVYGAVTKQPAPYTIPLGSEEWNQILPGQSNTPHANLARMAGQAVAPVPIAPIVKNAVPVAKAAGSLIKDTAELAMSPIQTGKTAMEAFGRGYKNPNMIGEKGSALMPIRETYYPHEQVAEYQAGTRGPLEMSEKPTSELIQSPTQRWAQNMAPTNQAGQPLVAPAGKGFEGYMENLGATYKQNPLMGALDVAGTVGGLLTPGVHTPIPVSAIAKAGPALAARTLQKATQFEPGFEAAAVQAAQGRAGLEANMPPQTPALPAPGPVTPSAIPMPGPQRNVNIEGQSYTLPNKIDISNSQAATPKQKSMEVAASKIQPVQPAEIPQPVQQAPAAAPAPKQAPATTTGAVEPTPLPESAITTQAEPAKKTRQTKQKAAPDLTTTQGKVEAIEITKAEEAKTFGQHFDSLMKKFEKAKKENPNDPFVEDGGKRIIEITKKKGTLKANPDFEVSHQIKYDPAFNHGGYIAYGVEKSTGTPVMIKDNYIYKQHKNKFEFYKKYDSNGNEVHYDDLSNMGAKAKELWGEQPATVLKNKP